MSPCRQKPGRRQARMPADPKSRHRRRTRRCTTTRRATVASSNFASRMAKSRSRASTVVMSGPRGCVGYPKVGSSSTSRAESSKQPEWLRNPEPSASRPGKAGAHGRRNVSHRAHAALRRRRPLAEEARRRARGVPRWANLHRESDHRRVRRARRVPAARRGTRQGALRPIARRIASSRLTPHPLRAR